MTIRNPVSSKPGQRGMICGETRAEQAFSARGKSKVDLLRDRQGVIDLNAKVSNCACNLCVP